MEEDSNVDDGISRLLISAPEDVVMERIESPSVEGASANPLSQELLGAVGGIDEEASVVCLDTVTGVATLINLKHPTGVFRRCPIPSFEIPPANIPTTSQPMIPTYSARNSPPSPSQSPERDREENTSWWYRLHCRLCCRSMRSSRSSDYDDCCDHIDEQDRAQLIEREDSIEEVIDSTVSAGSLTEAMAPSHRPLFGEELSVAVERSEHGIPMVVAVCVYQIEQWCTDNRAEAASVYFSSGLPSDVDKIKAAFNRGEHDQVTLENFDVHAISRALQLYLMELPNPVIPVESYHKLLKESSKTTQEDDYELKIYDIVNELPNTNRETLIFILTHIAKLSVWQHELCTNLQEGRKAFLKAAQDFRNLVPIFADLLMRPAWNEIAEITKNICWHDDILYNILTTGHWGIVMPPFTRRQHPVYPETTFQESFGPLQSPESSLLDTDWYWGKQPRNESYVVLKNTKNGSFLVRDAATRPGEFTIVVKFKQKFYCLRIQHENGRYGFAEPLDFSSVVGLICWSRCNSLCVYNNELKIRLLYPVRRVQQPEDPIGAIHEVVWNYAVYNRKAILRKAQLEFLYQWRRYYNSGVRIYEHLYDILQDWLKITDDLIRKQQYRLDNGTEEQLPTLREVMDEFKSRRGHIQDIRGTVKSTVLEIKAKLRMIEGERALIFPDVKFYTVRRERWKAWLIAQGMKKDFITSVSLCMNLSVETPTSLCLRDESLWRCKYSQREAEEALKKKRRGTFLVRLDGDHEILSVMDYNNFIHWPIKFARCEEVNCKEKSHGLIGFGFNVKCPRMTTLVNLIVHFSRHPLYPSNNVEEESITLKFPIFWPRNDAQ